MLLLNIFLHLPDYLRANFKKGQENLASGVTIQFALGVHCSF